MANLTWRDTVAPNFGGVQDSINSAARLFGNAATGAGAALDQFGDQGVLQQLAQYNDAQKLQADLQSGQFSTANASAEALSKIMGRPSTLLDNAAAQQTADYRGQLNPLLLASQQNQNDQSVFSLGKDRQVFDRTKGTTWANEDVDRKFAMDERQRAITDRTDQESAISDIAKWQSSGELNGEAGANKFKAEAVAAGKGRAYIAALDSSFASRFPGSYNMPLESLTGGPSSSSVGSGTAIPAGMAKVAGDAAAKFGLPPEYFTGMLKMEGGMTGAISPTGATGPGQFTQGTWNNLAKTPEGKALGMTEITSANFQKDNDPRKNADINIMASGLLAKENAGYITKAGLPVTPQNLYLVHNVGPGILDAIKTGKPSADTLDAMKKNGFKDGDTVASWTERHLAKFNSGMPSKAENALSAASATDAITLANASSGSSDAQRLLSVAAESQGKDNSVATIGASLTGKDGPLNKVPPREIEAKLSLVMSKLGVNGSVAAELLKMAGGSTDRSLNILGAGPWIAEGINEDRLGTLIDKYKSNDGLLKSLRTGAVYKQNAEAVTDGQATQKKADDAVKVAKDAMLKGKPGAEKLLAESLIKQEEARFSSQEVSQTSANAAAVNMPTDAPPVKKVEALLGAAATPKAASTLADSAAPLRSTNGGKTWQLDIEPSIRNPRVSYYQMIDNPVFTALKGKSFASKEEAKRAYQTALEQAG